MKYLSWIGLIIIGVIMTGCSSQNAMEQKSKVTEIKLPIHKEVTQQPLAIQGSIPEWLKGTFVRNGPVSVEINNQKQAHWFDGLAMLHAFSFENGKITYTNKFLKTDPYNTVFLKGSVNFLGFDSITPHPIWSRIRAFFQSKSCPPLQNADVTVAKVAHQYIALTETPLPVRFDIKTMDTLGALQFQDNLPKQFIFDSAHVKMDGRTGEQFNYLVDYGFRSNYVVYRYHPDKPFREVIGKIPVKKPAYMHSFALTENYLILVEFPLVVNPINIMFMTKPFIKNYYWNPKQGTNFIVIDRKTGKIVKKIRSDDSFFAFHHVNAYEESDKVILDIVTYPDARIIPEISQHGYLSSHFGVDENLPSSKLMRYTLSLQEGCTQASVIFEGSLELPRINEQHNAYQYRYIYGSDQRLLVQPKDLRPIYKIDTKTGQRKSWEEAGVLPGEPIFIPHPKSQEEDEGVVVNIVLDVDKKKAFLLILDGKTFKEIGRAYAPFAIPTGLHGQFF